MKKQFLFTRVGYAYLPVQNINQSIAWYTENLGLKLMDKFEDRGSMIAILHYPHKNGIALVLIETADAKPLELMRNGTAYPVLSMNCPDIERTYRHMKNNGVEAEELCSLGEGEARYFYFRDNQGNLLEASWSRWDQEDEMKDSFLTETEKDYHIRPAKTEELPEILRVFEAARAYMQKSGNPTQWGDSHPASAILEKDIKKGQLYVYLEKNIIHGAFAFIIGSDAAYANIEDGAWKNDRLYGTIHRIASDGAVKGVFRRCVDFCKEKIDNLRIDTHHENKTMQHLIAKNGFEKCGIIYVEDGSPRIAYQYVKSE